MMDSADDPDYLYDNVIMPYKAELEAWFVQKRGLKLYFELIAFTVLVVLLPRKVSVWNYFEDLPPPPARLARELRYPD